MLAKYIFAHEHCFLAMFPEGGQNSGKKCFLAMFSGEGQIFPQQMSHTLGRWKQHESFGKRFFLVSQRSI
jgi:metallophosphoesterase superfamily enzyme